MSDKKISTIDDVISDFSHEVRNSLMVISGYLEFIKKGKKDNSLYIKKIEESVKDILAELARLKKAVENKTKY